MAGAEQSFLDELAEAMEMDPIDFRLELLKRAEENPVGETNEYDPARYAGVKMFRCIPVCTWCILACACACADAATRHQARLTKAVAVRGRRQKLGG